MQHPSRLRDLLRGCGGTFAAAALVGAVLGASPAQAQDPNDPGILEPVLTELRGEVVRIPNTDQADGDVLLNVKGDIERNDALGRKSLLGHNIERVRSPNRAMEETLKRLSDAAGDGNSSEAEAAAKELRDILIGETNGEIFDGFAMLNFNRGAFANGHVKGEYKMRELQRTGETVTGVDGQTRDVWEADINYLYYDGQIDSDLFLLKVPVDVHRFDEIHLNYRVFTLETEDFSPTMVTRDFEADASVQFIFKGYDAVWIPMNGGEILKFTVKYPSNEFFLGIYQWGWRVHPPRIQFIQPVREIVNQHTGEVEFDPPGQSFTFRNRQLSIEGIGDAAPEKKMYKVATATLDGTDLSTIHAWMNDPDQGPRGTWDQWADLAENQRQLPPEARDVLDAEGIPEGEFGPYDFVTVYVNNEMYGNGPENERIRGWQQGEQLNIKLINLDNHTHYYRNVDFGARLHDDIVNCCGSGSHSFEIANFKGNYGVPKSAEPQWRAGWGFRPHHDVIQQPDVFPRASDQNLLKTYFDGSNEERLGYQYSEDYRGGDFRFNPPPFIIGTEEDPSEFRLREGDGSEGLLIGQLTEPFGIAKMCSNQEFDLGEFCREDISQFNPHNVKNVDTDGDGVNDVLWFPPFLRNPNENGGDIIPPTIAWKTFWFLSPDNGTLFIDPNDPSQGFWVDRTFAHGRPVFANSDTNALIEQPRASAQVFYQFDPLFHDNDIFSPHPSTSFEEPPQE